MSQSAADASATSVGTTGTAPGASLSVGSGLFGKTPTTPVTPTPATGPAAETSTTKTPDLLGTKTEEKKDGAATTPTPGELHP